MKKLTKKERLARNEYSRLWKAAHKKLVKKWNRDWYIRTRKAA